MSVNYIITDQPNTTLYFDGVDGLGIVHLSIQAFDYLHITAPSFKLARCEFHADLSLKIRLGRDGEPPVVIIDDPTGSHGASGVYLGARAQTGRHKLDEVWSERQWIGERMVQVARDVLAQRPEWAAGVCHEAWEFWVSRMEKDVDRAKERIEDAKRHLDFELAELATMRNREPRVPQAVTS